MKKQNQSYGNLPVSPKSHQAALLTNARRQQAKNLGSNNPIALLDQHSNQDLKVDSQLIQSHSTTQQQYYPSATTGN